MLKMDKLRRVRKTSPQQNLPATSSGSLKSSNSTKFTIEQKVESGAVKKGPYSVKRTVDPKDLTIKRRLGEGSKPLFSRSDIRVNQSLSPKKESARRDSSSDSSSPDDRNRYRTNSTRSQANKRESAEKVPYFMDQKRERDRIERVYGRSRRSRSLSYERRKRNTASHHSRYRDKRSSSRDRYRGHHRSEYSRSRSRSRERRGRSHRNESVDERLQPVTQFIPIPVPVEYPYMQSWGTPMMPPPPRFPYMMRPVLPPPIPFMPRHFRPPRYMQNAYGRGHFRPRQY